MPLPAVRLRPAKTARGRALAVTTAAVALGLIVIASLAIGARGLTLGELWNGLTRADPIVASVLWEQRVPRTAVGLLAGAGLAVAGVLMQTLTRNPLADPRIFGVAAGASLGVVIGLSVLGLTGIGQYVWFGIAGALVAGLVGYTVSTRPHRRGRRGHLRAVRRGPRRQPSSRAIERLLDQGAVREVLRELRGHRRRRRDPATGR